jgi:ABC-type transport system involved in multi-copper enzyme maturation permease subunit
MQRMMNNFRIMWACAKKDFHTSLTERIFLLTLIMIPLQYLFLFIIFVLPADHAPTAVVMLDNGPRARQLYNAMDNAHSFSLSQASYQDAESRLAAGKIVAVVTIPANFDASVDKNLPVRIPVQINNLNTDFTEDIRRAVPLSITEFYAKAYPSTIKVGSHEHDFYPQDTGYIPYIGVSILVLALALGGAIQSGTSWAREWELGTMKELLLSPASRWSLIAGKMVGAFFMALVSSFIVLLALIFPLHTHPMHLGETLLYMLLTLLIFSALGTLIGTLVRQRRLITTIVLGSSLFVFFVSGPLGPPSFDTAIINFISKMFPLGYAIAGEQHAFHGYATNTLGAWNAVILVGFAVGFLVISTLVLRKKIAS